MEIEKKWTQPIHNWGLIMNQFMLMFENRIQSNHSIFRYDNFIGCFSADKIKMSVRK